MENLNELECCFIALDKPIGITSHDACMYVKKILQVSKAGHAGTLDPAVSGVLIIGINKATKLLQYLQSDKEYVGVMHLHKDASMKKIKQIIKKQFLGKIKQLVPRKSRVLRREREREIYSFEILEKKERDILFCVSCEAGTYIRKLCHDIGIALDVGANMSELRRIRHGCFSEKDKNFCSLYQLHDAFKDCKKRGLKKFIIAPEKALSTLPKIYVSDEVAKKLRLGQFLFACEIKRMQDFEKDQAIMIISNKKLVCIAMPFFSKREILSMKKKNSSEKVIKPKTVL